MAFLTSTKGKPTAKILKLDDLNPPEKRELIETGPPADEPKNTSSSIHWFVWVLLLLLGIGIIVGIYWFFYRKNNDDDDALVEEDVEQPEEKLAEQTKTLGQTEGEPERQPINTVKDQVLDTPAEQPQTLGQTEGEPDHDLE